MGERTVQINKDKIYVHSLELQEDTILHAVVGGFPAWMPTEEAHAIVRLLEMTVRLSYVYKRATGALEPRRWVTIDSVTLTRRSA
jgi:hypothetical protein